MRTQHSVSVDIKIYSAKEREKLKKYSNYSDIEALTTKPLQVPTEQFLTYYLFGQKRPGVSGWRSYGEIKKKVGLAAELLDGFIVWDGNSISVSPNAGKLERNMTENVGVSIALSIVNELHGLTTADWGQIPEGPQKSLDYKFASNGKEFIQVEAKGTAQPDNTRKDAGGSIYSQAKSIREKKAELGARLSGAVDSVSFNYGVITSIQEQSPAPLKAWVLDPPPELISRQPKDIQLINRVRFLSDLISFIFPRSQFSAALATRLVDLESIRELWSLNKKPLMRGSSKPYEEPPLYNSKSRSEDGKAVGMVVQLSSKDFFFVGIQDELLQLAVRQNFDEILDYKFSLSTKVSTITCCFPQSRFNTLVLPEWIKRQVEEQRQDNGLNQYVEFTLLGDMIFSTEGYVFGMLPLENQEN